MKLLHVSDWHLGRSLYNASRAEDHERVLGEIVDLARHERPDLIVHTGDLFESPRPAYEDMERAIQTLRELGSLAKVVVLAGNHDSPALFRLFTDLVGPQSPIRFVDRPCPPDEGGMLRLPGPGGEVVRLAVLPFVQANRIVQAFEDANGWMVTYADRIQKIEEALWDGLMDGHDPSREVLLFAAHLHVAGSTFSQSERPIHITDSYATRAEHVPAVSYAAFGHIHKPQALPGTTQGRYAGSPIPLDFGEMGEEKTVVIVEARPGRPPDVRPIPLSGGRPLRRLEGTLSDLRRHAPSVGRALCLVTVKTEQPVLQLSDQVREILPEATLLQVVESCEARRVTIVERQDPQATELTFEEMLREYLVKVGTKTAPTDRVLSTFGALLSAVEREEHAAFAEEMLARDVEKLR